MLVIKHRCDRCKRDIKPDSLKDNPFKNIAENIYKALGLLEPKYRIENTRNNTYLELCDKCERSFNIWLNNSSGVNVLVKDLKKDDKQEVNKDEQ